MARPSLSATGGSLTPVRSAKLEAGAYFNYLYIYVVLPGPTENDHTAELEYQGPGNKIHECVWGQEGNVN